MIIRSLICLLLTLTLCFSAALAQEAKDLITREDLENRVATHLNLNLFDLRDEDAFDAGHIPSAASFPLDELKGTIQSILNSGFSYMQAEIVVYGETEEDGVAAAEILRDLGFTNVTRFRALEDWTGRLMTAAEEARILGAMDTVDLAGNPADASILKDYKLTMVNVWATYCGPCLSEMPELGRLAADMKDAGVQIIGLISDVVDENMEADETQLAYARQIVEQTKADYPHILPDASLFRNVIYQISAVPTTFFVDETGMLVGSVYVGSRDYDAWKEIIEDVLTQLP